MTSEAKLRVSRAVGRLRNEGLPQEQAVAKAMAMERNGRLREDGTYIKVVGVPREE